MSWGRDLAPEGPPRIPSEGLETRLRGRALPSMCKVPVPAKREGERADRINRTFFSFLRNKYALEKSPSPHLASGPFFRRKETWCSRKVIHPSLPRS